MATLTSPGVEVIVRDPLESFYIPNLDVFFLSYDEPNAEENWVDLLRKCPRANRVHGVKGIDAAHRMCADQSSTDRFITIDGDTRVHPEFFKLCVGMREGETDCTFSWAGWNVINGLVYGNGGIKCWTKDFVYNMKSHENAESDDKKVDFCWDPNYHQIREEGGPYASTYPNGSPFQAFRAGLREGVKLSLDRGKRMPASKFNTLWHENIHKLAIWCSVGADVENGLWSIFGARMGVDMAVLSPWCDHTMISDYDRVRELWDSFTPQFLENEDALRERNKRLGNELKTKLIFPIAELDVDGSKFFKAVYMPSARRPMNK
jgi:hypothetical protein